MSVFEHLTGTELFGMFLGILLTWWLKFSKTKNEFDKKNEVFEFGDFWKKWFTQQWDDIGSHLLVSFSALWMGVDNFRAWMGDTVKVPEGVDEIGAAFIIGFVGSYVANVLKKGV